MTADWQPISTAPKDGRLVILWALNIPAGKGKPISQYRIAHWRWGAWRAYQSRHHLHAEVWMELPPPPDEIVLVGRICDEKGMPSEVSDPMPAPAQETER
jgi:hypothetical protein